MTGWVVLSLGGVDLRFLDPATSDFLPEDTSSPPEERIDARYVPLNNGAGAALASWTIAEAPAWIDVIAAGTDVADAESKLAALQTILDSAVNGTAVVYEYQLDTGATLWSWNVLGGRVRPRWHTAEGNAIIFALAGRAVAFAHIELTLSAS